MPAFFKKALAVGLVFCVLQGPAGAVICQTSGGSSVVPPVVMQEFGSQTLAPRSLEQDRSPFAPSLTYHLERIAASFWAGLFGFPSWQPAVIDGNHSIESMLHKFSEAASLPSSGSKPVIRVLFERELRTWLINIAAKIQEKKMRELARQYVDEFLASTAEGTALWLTFRLNDDWRLEHALRREMESPSGHQYLFREALNLLINEAERQQGSLSADRRKSLSEIWNSYIRKIELSLDKVAGEEVDDITLELNDVGGFKLHIWIAHWSPTIAQWAHDFRSILEKKIPDQSLAGRQEILFFTRDMLENDPPQGDGGPRKLGWIKKLLQQPLSSVWGFGAAVGVAGILLGIAGAAEPAGRGIWHALGLASLKHGWLAHSAVMGASIIFKPALLQRLKPTRIFPDTVVGSWPSRRAEGLWSVRSKIPLNPTGF